MSLSFTEYAQKAIQTDKYNGGSQRVDSHAFSAALLGLVGESGEIAEKIKKIYWHKDGAEIPEDRSEVLKELGDVLWYLNTLSVYLDSSLEEVAQQNLIKLESRQSRGVLVGNGDNR